MDELFTVPFLAHNLIGFVSVVMIRRSRGALSSAKEANPFACNKEAAAKRSYSTCSESPSRPQGTIQSVGLSICMLMSGRILYGYRTRSLPRPSLETKAVCNSCAESQWDSSCFCKANPPRLRTTPGNHILVQLVSASFRCSVTESV